MNASFEPRTELVVIERRFNGPADAGQGGYVAGVLARALGQPAEVTLRHPTPLQTPLTITWTSDSTLVLDDGPVRLAEAGAATVPVPDVPTPPTLADATAAGAAAAFRDPARHPYPECFVCGSARTEGDGLRIIPGPLTDRVTQSAQVADVWVPDDSVADAAGLVREEFVWAALDCPSGIAGLALSNTPLIVLGRMTADLRAEVTVGEPVICTGWLIGRSGRKLSAGSGLFAPDGRPLAIAITTWIAVNR